ncbi:MAG: hypothetical protein AAGO57_01270 [Pseudomonadota bacterium]
MNDHPADSAQGFTATDGRYIETPKPTELPDGPLDIERFRNAASEAARHAAERAFERQFSLIDGAIGAATSGLKWAAGLAGQLNIPQNQHFTEEVLFEARRKRASSVEPRVDALLTALRDPKTCFEFARRLSDIIGFPATRYANAYQTYMQAENRWAIELVEALPPARLAPALSGLVRPWLFDPYRTWFFEPALQRFLESPHGDLRHLDGDVPIGEPAPPINLGFDPLRMISGEMSMGDMIKAAKKMHSASRARQAADDTRGRDVSEHLGVTVTNAEVDAMGDVGTDLLHRAREKKRFGWQPAGVFLAEGLRNGLSPRAAALPDRVWAPYIAEHGALLDRALGISKDASANTSSEPRHAMALMRKLPALPQRSKDAVFRIALGKKKSGRADAQRLLRGTTGLIGRLAKEGQKKALDKRLQAAACLGFTKDKAAIPALENMLVGEKNRVAENTILSSLQALGANVNAYAPDQDALVAEAEAVFDAAYPKDQQWLADLDLPELYFATGKQAPVTLGPWLLRLAADLGSPKGGPLLTLRLAHLSKTSRIDLATAVLSGWTAYDAFRWDALDPVTDRNRLVPHAYREYRHVYEVETEFYRTHDPERFARRRPVRSLEDYASTLTEAGIQKFIADRMKWGPYPNSGHAARGVLALTKVLPVGEIKRTLRSYINDHSRRTAQIQALMDLISSYPGKTPVIELTGLADQLSQKTLRAHAINTLEDMGVTYLAPMNESDDNLPLAK